MTALTTTNSMVVGGTNTCLAILPLGCPLWCALRRRCVGLWGAAPPGGGGRCADRQHVVETAAATTPALWLALFWRRGCAHVAAVLPMLPSGYCWLLQCQPQLPVASVAGAVRVTSALSLQLGLSFPLSSMKNVSLRLAPARRACRSKPRWRFLAASTRSTLHVATRMDMGYV